MLQNAHNNMCFALAVDKEGKSVRQLATVSAHSSFHM